MSWFRKAAAQGNADAQYILGTMLHLGLGAAKSDDEAVFWYRKATELGNAAAQGALRELDKSHDNTPGFHSGAESPQPSPNSPTAVSKEDIRDMIQAAMKETAGGHSRAP
jgi:TPR repeat protein